jgi:hypothetical protein
MHEVPERCQVCWSNPPVFYYEWLPYSNHAEPHVIEGFCCAACAAEFLRDLKHGEAREWAKEEAALEADESDLTGMREHRLTAFAATE